MSHYAVLVLHREDQGIEDLLAPYDENLKVEPYFKYTKEEALKLIKKNYVPHNDFLKGYTDEALIKWFCSQYSSLSLKNDGIYSTYNPDSKWDWWSLGGRFSDSLELKDEIAERKIKTYKEMYDDEYDNEWLRYVDEAKVSDIKWIKPFTDEQRENTYKWWMANIEQDNNYSDYKEEFFLWKPEYYKERYKDVDTYIKTQEYPCYHSIITPDGVWHEASHMGWFACTDGKPSEELQWDLNFYDTFIKPNLNSDLITTIVDCHI